jgi:hypothetical protein
MTMPRSKRLCIMLALSPTLSCTRGAQHLVTQPPEAAFVPRVVQAAAIGPRASR